MVEVILSLWVLLVLSNAHTKALKRIHSPLRRMVHFNNEFRTGSHLQMFGGHDDLLPPLQVKIDITQDPVFFL